MISEDPDLALVRALQAGEDRAWDSLMARHQDGLFRFVFRHISNEADAVEVTQDAFVRAYFNIEKFRPTAKFVTWLYHIALNLCRTTQEAGLTVFRPRRYPLMCASRTTKGKDHFHRISVAG